MHWVQITAPDGLPAIINLDAIVGMGTTGTGDGTLLFTGGLAINGNGQFVHATLAARETPGEILALPAIDPKDLRRDEKIKAAETAARAKKAPKAKAKAKANGGRPRAAA